MDRLLQSNGGYKLDLRWCMALIPPSLPLDQFLLLANLTCEFCPRRVFITCMCKSMFARGTWESAHALHANICPWQPRGTASFFRENTRLVTRNSSGLLASSPPPLCLGMNVLGIAFIESSRTTKVQICTVCRINGWKRMNFMCRWRAFKLSKCQDANWKSYADCRKGPKVHKRRHSCRQLQHTAFYYL